MKVDLTLKQEIFYTFLTHETLINCKALKKHFYYFIHVTFYILVDIPMRLILTKVDKLDLCGSGELSGIFRSRHAEITVKRAKEIFGFQNCQILPIANYVDENSRNVIKDVLILLALDNILQEALDYASYEQ